MSRTAALILAGTKPGTENRALWQIGERRMVEYVADALNAALPDGTRRVVAGDDLPPLPGFTRVPSGKTRLGTLQNALAVLAPSETRLLVATADIPFLTPAAVTDLLTNAPDADFVYAIVPIQTCQERFPTLKRTTLRTAEGTFTGGNLILLRPDFLRTNAATIEEAEKRRKSVFGLAQLLGGGMIARLLASFVTPQVLSVAYLEAAISRALGGASVRAYVSNYAEVGTDIDCAEERALAERLLR
jgi:molybdopterin-guanine dinucleotide biosynthesis protein A